MKKYLLAALPLLVGALATVAALAAGEARSIVSTTAVAWLWFIAGAAGSGILALVFIGRARRRFAENEGMRRGAAAQLDNQARLLSRLDHELKNPITAILAGVSNLDPEQPSVASIQAQAERLSRLLTDLRKLGELRTVALEREPVSLEAVAGEVVAAMAELPETAERSITLSFPRAPRPLPSVLGDADLLFLALYNLVSNAAKYSAPGDTIEVRGSEGDGMATIEVADTGRGIADAEQESVWEELSRGRDALDVPGSGLGLPFVRTIVERHGGSVQLRSRAGEGTLVRLSVPLA